MKKKDWYEEAEYKEQQIPAHKGNMRIEALSNSITNPKVLINEVEYIPKIEAEILNLTARERGLELEVAVKQFFKPTPHLVQLYYRIDGAIRTGYVLNNPTNRKIKESGHGITRYNREGSTTTSDIILILGESGVGKTKLISEIMSFYQLVIQHVEYAGIPQYELQIPIIKIELAPHGSIKGMGTELLGEIDNVLGEEKYRKRVKGTNTQYVMREVKNKAEIHGIGLIVIDEIQNLTKMEEKKDDVIEFLLYMTNEVKVPLLLVGTPEAEDLFDTTFRAVRRVGTAHKIKRFRNDEQWESFVKALFKIQYVRKPSEPSQKIIDYLYENTQGIVSLAIEQFVDAQKRAMKTGIEEITINILKSVSLDTSKNINRAVTGIKKKDKELIETYPDLILDESDSNSDESKRKANTRIKKNEDMVKIHKEAVEQEKNVHKALKAVGDVKDSSEFIQKNKKKNNNT